MPKDYSISLNEKVRLLGLKTLLSAKLYEEKIILIEDEKLKHGKTVYLNEIVKPYKNDKLLFLTGFQMDKNFELASQNLETLNVTNPQTFNIIPIMKADWIFITVQGLKDLEMLLENREQNLFRNRKVPREELPYDKIMKPTILRA